MKITQVPTDHVPASWGKASKLLEPAVKRSKGRWTMDSLYVALRCGTADLWISFEQKKKDIVGAAVTSIRTYPNKKTMEIVFLGGKNFDEWLTDGMNLFKKYAMVVGCDCIETIGRHGLLKKIKAEGFEAPYTVYECNLKRIGL